MLVGHSSYLWEGAVREGGTGWKAEEKGGNGSVLASALLQGAEGGEGKGDSGQSCLSGTTGRGPLVEMPCPAGAKQATEKPRESV